MNRRDLLRTAVAGSCGGGLWSVLDHVARHPVVPSNVPPAFSVIPVVGDGRWIWKEPPEGETGYLEPRPYEVSVGIEMEGTGSATDIVSTTAAPLAHSEQKIDESSIGTSGCQAQVRKLAEGAGQLVLSAAEIGAGQVIRATAHFRMTLFKQFFGYHADQFPARQQVPPDVRKTYLQDSPGIQVRSRQVRSLAAELTEGTPKHPFEQARTFAEWVPKNIKPQIGDYTSVTAALDDHRGDCEEMAAVFVALCRAVGIPARLVWVPNHNWAEFFMSDKDGKGHWIPAHTACYSWFGFNGAHELVLQKGDRLMLPERRKQVRLLADWTRYSGSAPKIRYTAELTPLATEPGGDAGPGARRKDAKGEWQLVGDHALDSYQRR
ncbi:MAG TPA: transglutaminase-like domain-containing protein [Pirellulales bacterium]|nr:transglutaminase-like domain-containing protein [Pirellulales bacterium]